ncbi:MAG TPA: hypothetical protein VKU00_16335 [Chthonomonadaceae bacterium]|nr:hypothetical protein [Chthonomonadaceae bacterium]
MRVYALMALALLLALCSAVQTRAGEVEGPYVYKSSIHINTQHYLVYWPSPTAKEPQYLTGSWAPRFDFNVQGPLEGGSQISVSFFKPDGAKWLTRNLNTEETAKDTFQHFMSDGLEMEKQATTQTGIFTIKIELSNALTKTDKTLFTGKFEVGKFHYGTAPNEKNQNDYFVNHDWTLPIGQMSFDTHGDAEAPKLLVSLWFRGPSNTSSVAGYLYFNGKQISSTKSMGGVHEAAIIRTGTTQEDMLWTRWTFHFARVAEARKGNSANNYPDMWWLDKNPGDYEIKILRDGKLARSAKFTIGADGKLVDNGLAEKNNMGFGVILFPVNVEPGMDGKANTTNYKAQAYYGNSLVGFP